MVAFYITDKNGKKLYVKSIDKANETIEWTDNPSKEGVYTNSSGFYANADFDFIKFHFMDKYPNIDTLKEDENF